MDREAKQILAAKSREAGMKDLAVIITNWLMEMGMFTTCCNCAHWNDETEMCDKFNARPPAKIIVQGCGAHQEIPF